MSTANGTSASDFPTETALRPAHDAVARLIHFLVQAITHLASAIRTNPGAGSESVEAVLLDAHAAVDPLIRQAESLLTQPILDEFEAAGSGPSTHVVALNLALRVRQSIVALLNAPETYTRNDVHNWLEDINLNLGQFRLGLRNPRARYTPRFGITFEFEEAVRRREREQRRRPALPPRGKVGRKPDPTLPKVTDRVRELRETEMQWKEVAQAIRDEFHRPYTVDTLRKLQWSAKSGAK